MKELIFPQGLHPNQVPALIDSWNSSNLRVKITVQLQKVCSDITQIMESMAGSKLFWDPIYLEYTYNYGD